MLLEGLIAVLIFSMGILAIVGMQAATLKASGDAKYRSDAGMLANQLVGTMLVSNRLPATLKANFDSSVSGAPSYATWSADVQNALPGVAANPPTVSVVDATDASATSRLSQVTITIFWQAPNDSALHQYINVVEIGCAVQTSGLCT